MASRLLIGALLGATAATVYQKVKTTKPPTGTSRVADLADKANERVDAVAADAEKRVDAVEQAVGEGIKFVAGAAHKFIGSTQERTEGISANIKRTAGDYAKQAAKDQLTKQASRLFQRVVDEAQQVVKDVQAPPKKQATPSPQAQSAPKPAAAPAAAASEEDDAPIPAMVRLEAERYARDHRANGFLAAAVDDERKAITFFITKGEEGNFTGGVPVEIMGYKVYSEYVPNPGAQG